ncbi:MAG TPA: hypothetical protein PLL53_00465 [Saprospiraceae bacterium]|nr:hypothetical protein [Saprospiraceae bacterium]
METNHEVINAWAEMIGALAWPLVVLVLFPFLLKLLHSWVVGYGKEIAFSSGKISLVVKPTEASRPPANATPEEKALRVGEVQNIEASPGKALPADYFFLNHTSFLRPDKQEEFQKRTGIARKHYDIQLIVDSYYRDAMQRIEYVEYLLHRAYPHPVQYRRSAKDHFMLKELANGEYVALARVYLKDAKEPLVLQRYISLWESGPRLDNKVER